MRAFSLHDLAERRGPGVGHGRAQALVLGDDHDVGTALRDLGRGLAGGVSEHERDVRAAELAGELSALRDELERGSRGPAAERLYERPAIVRLARLLTEALGLLPGRSGPRALVEQGRHALGGLLGGRCELAGAVGRHVAHREDASRRAGLAEAFVVLAQVVD